MFSCITNVSFVLGGEGQGGYPSQQHGTRLRKTNDGQTEERERGQKEEKEEKESERAQERAREERREGEKKEREKEREREGKKERERKEKGRKSEKKRGASILVGACAHGNTSVLPAHYRGA